MERSRAVGAPYSFTPPQEYCHAQTGLPASLHPTRTPSRYLQWLLCPFVRFTVTGVARSFHPYSLGRCSPASALIGRRCTRYSFKLSIVWFPQNVNLKSAAFRRFRNFSFLSDYDTMLSGSNGEYAILQQALTNPHDSTRSEQARSLAKGEAHE